MSLLSILALGFLLGMRHATDADHVVAVTTIVSRQPSLRAAARIGALWGLGHAATLLVVGGGLLVFRFVVPPHVGLGMELVVALMLVLLGALNLTSAFHRIQHAAKEEAPRAGRVRPVLIGVVHGLAGSAAVALLMLTTIRERFSALGYLVVFGVGTIGGMMMLTSAMAMPLAAAARRFGSFDRTVARATGLLSIALGIYLCYRVGYVDGFFSAHPRWTPD